MSRAAAETKAQASRSIRCAIYTRKSSEEGLEQEFNSLDAQRESAEAYIASQKTEGWLALPDRYDDGGFSGGNIDRPALERLLADIEAGKIDCVVVYKVDRLSRSLLDFSRIVEIFDRHHVSFVSVTQHFNTTHSMGRLTLNILLSFAQFEREIIGERIRDKIAAQRRKGKWAGGVPVLGYDVDRSGPSPKLVINATEAARVRRIFELYMEKGSLLPVVVDLNHRKWRTKEWTTKKNGSRGGFAFDKCNLYGLLTNPLYIGKIKHKADYFDGEHEAIVAPELFTKVQDLLQYNGRSGGFEVRNRYGALLRRLLHCKACGKAMVHTFTGKRGKRGQQYRYYTCTGAIKSGRDSCPSGSLSAPEIEEVVLNEVRCIGQDPSLLSDVVSQIDAGVQSAVAAIDVERGDIEREIARHHKEIRKLITAGQADAGTIARVADLHDQVQRGERQLAELDAKTIELERDRVNEEEAVAAFTDFDAVWRRLSPSERARVFSLLVARVEYDAREATVAVTFLASGIKALARDELEKAA